ncbi:uncharacterized protein LOC131020160 [Salvia miltiorrhiza]|uniref:uncharacterized protein LOC131020160 n=2 Tax=Salvia miltiorrhiza TaxID=226208 RepID=UPI0025AC9232|nr:uncharacterized protein LOC131020160 [Salvia miltiorrhiza]
MDNDPCAPAPSTNTNTTSTSRAKRGKVCLTKVAQRRAKGVIQHVDFNARGQPVGEAAAEMQSYIGLLTRDHVKINIKKWKAVPQDVKDLIWDTVKSSYDVPEQWKAGCMESANAKWRSWKCRMYNEFIVPCQDDASKLQEPPPGSGILPLEWNQFVVTRLSTEFKNFSAQQKERRSKNIYPHRLSRKGYAKFAEELKTSDLHGDEDIDRATMWKKARLTKDGEVQNDNLKNAFQKIDDCIREKEEGRVDSSSCSSDLLSRALEKPEHSGRVRGLGAGVKPKSFFETPRVKKQEIDEKAQTELEEAKKQIKEQDGRILVLDKVIYELVSRIGKLESKVGDKDDKSEGLGSCSVIKPQKMQIENDEDMKVVENAEDIKKPDKKTCGKKIEKDEDMKVVENDEDIKRPDKKTRGKKIENDEDMKVVENDEDIEVVEKSVGLEVLCEYF